ncbi:MAG: thioredoxin family protein [Actinoplanes sp.]
MDPVGLSAIGVVLVVGVVAGVWKRRADGRLRPVAAGVEGRLDPGEQLTAGSAADADPLHTERVDPALLRELGVEPAPVTLLQFSSAFCAPCRAVRRVSSEVAAMLPDVRHVEVDAESHLAAVRALSIWRTPTLLVLDADGRIVKRATGVPGKPQLIAAVGELLS